MQIKHYIGSWGYVVFHIWKETRGTGGDEAHDNNKTNYSNVCALKSVQSLRFCVEMALSALDNVLDAFKAQSGIILSGNNYTDSHSYSLKTITFVFKVCAKCNAMYVE